MSEISKKNLSKIPKINEESDSKLRFDVQIIDDRLILSCTTCKGTISRKISSDVFNKWFPIRTETDDKITFRTWDKGTQYVVIDKKNIALIRALV